MRPRRVGLWLLLAGVGIALAAGVAVVLLIRPKPQPLTSELDVIIRHPNAKNSLSVEEEGALPVRAGGQMTLQVQFNKPAYVYLLWIDSTGQVSPLYPWNNETLEVTDARERPVQRIATRAMTSPATMGRGWPFGQRGGLETVVLLARLTPLGSEASPGVGIDPLPAQKMRHRLELVDFTLDSAGNPETKLARQRGTEEEAREIDRPLLEQLARLRDRFEVIRVVRFAHEGE